MATCFSFDFLGPLLLDRTKLKKQISTRENVAAAFADAAAEHSSCPSGRKGNSMWKCNYDR